MQESLFIGKNVIQLESIPSTNDYVKQLCDKQSVLDGTVVYTTSQTAGRGQQGNTWEMEQDAGLALSYFLKPSFLPIEKQFYLNMAVSLAVREFCEHYTEREVAIKWPNDILINQKKVAGVLIENTIHGSKIAQTVVGVGININQKKFTSELAHATSLAIEGDNGVVDFNIKSMLAVMSAYLEKYYLQLRQTNYQFLSKAYITSLWRYHQTQDFYKGNQLLRGEITGIYKDGRIEIDVNGKLHRYAMQEIKFIY